MNIKVFKIRISDNFLKIDENFVNEFLDHHEIINMNAKFISDDENYWSIMVYYNLKFSKTNSNHIFINSEKDLTDEEKVIYEALKVWRLKKAKELAVPSFYVCHNSHLMSIAKFKPIKIEEFSELKGFGETRTKKYGEEILEVLENV